MQPCRICNNSENNTEYLVNEMLFGTREKFKYFKCGKCGCLQIAHMPMDMSHYYPPEYNAFNKKSKYRNKSSLIRNKLRHIWKKAYIDRHMMPNKLLINFLGKPGLPEWIIRTGITTNSRILDIGCGDGSLLFQMREMGFKNLTGVDRYINFENVQYKRIKFFNKDISALSYSAKPAFDLVMLHHSFEHMRGQFETLNHIKNLLSDHGSVVIRIPVVPSFAWRKYGTNWFALDAPRHFFLHTEHSMQLVAEKTGFTIMNRYCDASPQTLWASEQYTKNIPFMDDRSLRFGLDKSIFTKKDLEGFVAKAQELNKSQDGDTACFILKKK